MTDTAKIQRKYAQPLRKLAVQFLATSSDPIARAFRGESLASGLGDYKTYLAQQAQNRTWGTYIEATALGALLDHHVVVTPIKNGIEQDLICLHRAKNDNARTVHLYNDNNTHWFTDDKTLGDGNCLYNAFAQSLYHHTKSPTLFQPSNEQSIIAHQTTIANAIQSQPKPAALKESFEKEKMRISQLSPEEQQQIASDYQIALKLAATNESPIKVCNMENAQLEQPVPSPMACR